MLLSKILKRKDLVDYSINSLEYNSKNVKENSIFFAMKGKKDNGNNYINDCLLKGCRTIITNDMEAYNKYKENKYINIFYYKNINKKMAEIAKVFYKDLSRKLYIIGITGTNGKTSTSTLIYKYLKSINIKSTLIGTNGVYIDDEYYEENNTTPNILDLYNYLYLSYINNIKYVVMEVSSHAIKLNRILGIKFKIKALTNITLDHLDFHKNIEDYKKTKLNWLKKDNFTKFIALNCLSRKINFESKVNVFKNSSKKRKWEEINVYKLNESINGTDFNVSSNKYGQYGKYCTNLLGDFNLQNICLFIAIIECLNKLDIYSLKSFFLKDIIIDGRINIIKEDNRYFVIDFAHTPDGVLNVLKLFNRFSNNIISVCGCGGNRDKTKRPIMGRVLSDYSKYSIFTSDNPRDEEANDIIDDMMLNVNKDNVLRIENRVEAIKKAYEISDNDDIILILGKGNESKQYIKEKVISISDFDILKDILGEEYE